MNIYIGNVLGFIGSAVGIGYFKSNNKNRICIFSIIMCMFQVASMLVLGAYNGMVVVICNIGRALLTRFEKWNVYWIGLLTSIIVFFTIYFYRSPLDFLCIVGVVVNNIGFLLMQKNRLKTFRWMRFGANIMWTGYYAYILNFASMGFEIVYTMVNLWEIYKNRDKKISKEI